MVCWSWQVSAAPHAVASSSASERLEARPRRTRLRVLAAHIRSSDGWVPHRARTQNPRLKDVASRPLWPLPATMPSLPSPTSPTSGPWLTSFHATPAIRRPGLMRLPLGSLRCQHTQLRRRFTGSYFVPTPMLRGRSVAAGQQLAAARVQDERACRARLLDVVEEHSGTALCAWHPGAAQARGTVFGWRRWTRSGLCHRVGHLAAERGPGAGCLPRGASRPRCPRPGPPPRPTTDAGHHGHRDDPLFWIRRLLRWFTDIADHEIPELLRLARNTLDTWREELLAYFDTGGVSNGPTEAIRGLIKKINESATATATSPTTDSAHSYTAASAGTRRLSRRSDDDHHAWLRRSLSRRCGSTQRT
jgi:Transposase